MCNHPLSVLKKIRFILKFMQLKTYKRLKEELMRPFKAVNQLMVMNHTLMMRRTWLVWRLSLCNWQELSMLQTWLLNIEPSLKEWQRIMLDPEDVLVAKWAVPQVVKETTCLLWKTVNSSQWLPNNGERKSVNSLTSTLSSSSRSSRHFSISSSIEQGRPAVKEIPTRSTGKKPNPTSMTICSLKWATTGQSVQKRITTENTRRWNSYKNPWKESTLMSLMSTRWPSVNFTNGWM